MRGHPAEPQSAPIRTRTVAPEQARGRPNYITDYLRPVGAGAPERRLRPRWCILGEDQDRKRRRFDFSRGGTRPPGDRPRPRRGRVRAGTVPWVDLPAQGTEDGDPPVP